MIRASRRTFTSGLAAAAALAASGQTAGAQSLRRLTVGIQGTPRSLEPLREFSNVAWRVGYNIFEGLLGIDYKNGLAVVPSLAESHRRLSPTVLEFTLKDGVRFHDGEIMTAEDVAFSFGPERMTGDKAPGRAIANVFVGTIERVEAVDRRTVRVATRATDPLIEQRLAGWGAQVVSKKAFLAAPSFEAWERAPVGTGPYKVADFRIDERCVLAAHQAYHGGKPPADELLFRVLPELAARMNALATGEADIVTEVSLDQIAAVEAMAGRHVVGGPILNFRALVFDKAHPQLVDPRVRRALSHAIDRKAIVDSLYGGRTVARTTQMHPAFGALNDPGRAGTPYDPDLAKRLLREAGYKGEPIPYRTHASYYTQQVQTAQVLVEMWREVGITIDLQVRENWQQIFDTSSPRGIRDWSNSILFQDPVGSLTRLYGPGGSVQTVSKEWSNAAFNETAKALETSLDLAERKRAFSRLLDIYETEDPPGCALHDLVMFYAKKRSVNWTPYPVESMDFGPGNLTVGA
jgi:peptide/nickel transport system substrate-binding protein